MMTATEAGATGPFASGSRVPGGTYAATEDSVPNRLVTHGAYQQGKADGRRWLGERHGRVAAGVGGIPMMAGAQIAR